jgi:hypothetical protein
VGRERVGEPLLRIGSGEIPRDAQRGVRLAQDVAELVAQCEVGDPAVLAAVEHDDPDVAEMGAHA